MKVVLNINGITVDDEGLYVCEVMETATGYLASTRMMINVEGKIYSHLIGQFKEYPTMHYFELPGFARCSVNDNVSQFFDLVQIILCLKAVSVSRLSSPKNRDSL